MGRLVCAVVLLAALFAATTPCRAEGGEHPFGSHQPRHTGQQEEHPLQQLFLALITRPGITSDSHRKSLLPAIHDGAEAFGDALGHRRAHRFSRDLKPLLAAYDAAISGAADGLAGAEARGAAMDRLLSCIIEVAKQSKIYPEEVDTAFLQAAAAVEKSLLRPPLAKLLSLEDRELVSLLLLKSVYQVHGRTVLLVEIPDALATLGVEASLAETYTKSIAWCGPALARELVALERDLSDPNILADLNNLIMMQFNAEATNDMFYAKVGLESYLAAYSFDLTPLAAKMASLGGIMAHMTPDLLRESGAVPLGLRYLAAFSWLEPLSPLVYAPDPALADRLRSLGGEVPASPDFSLFTSPYRDIFQLRYDLTLCELIMIREWWDAADQAFVLRQRPLSMTERLALRKADAERRQRVMGRLAGVTENEKHALRILMSGFFGK